MGQLSIFTRSELAQMRTPAASRRYSPEREDFRRDHRRRRGHGLQSRHADKLRRIDDEARVADLPLEVIRAAATWSAR